MLSAKKVVLIPANSGLNQYGGGETSEENAGVLTSDVKNREDRIKTKIYDKIHRFIKVILKLARHVGYDNDLRIKLKNGKFLEKSNIVDLLTHAMSVGKVLYGENEFIELLADSDVDPELIINENVRSKLIHFKNKGKSKREEEIILNERPRLNKRKRDASDDEDEIRYVKTPKKPDAASSQQMDEVTNGSKKRKLNIDLDEDTDIDDSMIDSQRWDIPKDE